MDWLVVGNFFVILLCVSHSLSNNIKSNRGDIHIIKKNLASSLPDSIKNGRQNGTADSIQDSKNKVRNSTRRASQVLIGDILYFVDEIFENKNSTTFERMNVIKRTLWRDEDGRSEFRYFYDSESNANRDIFVGAIKSWTDQTCVTVIQDNDGTQQTRVSQGTAIVGSYGGCFSNLGNVFHPSRPYAQQISVDPNGCELAAAAHEVGHGIGLLHMMSRPDRNDYIYFNPENLAVVIGGGEYREEQRGTWFQGQREKNDEITYTPSPYDYSSLMQYGATDFSDPDARIVFTVKDPTKLYAFNYHRPAGVMQTHYDLYVLNSAYGCLDLWKNNCREIGMNTPECKNYGYVGKNCECLCPPGTSGSNCENIEDRYPLLPRAKCLVIVNDETTVDLTNCGMTLENPHPIADFAGYQFFTVIGRARSTEEKVSMLIDPPTEKLESKYNLEAINSAIFNGVIDNECVFVMRIFIGDSTRNKIRTVCYSELYELDLHTVEFHSRDDELDFNGFVRIGDIFSEPEISLLMACFQVHVTFSENGKYLMPKDSEMSSPIDNTSDGVFSSILFYIIIVVCFVVCVGVYFKYFYSTESRAKISKHSDRIRRLLNTIRSK